MCGEVITELAGRDFVCVSILLGGVHTVYAVLVCIELNCV